MKTYKIRSLVALLAMLTILTFASSAFAVGCGGSPAIPPPPDSGTNGLKVEGWANGTKLSGVLEVSFSNNWCGPASCAPGTRGARAVLRLGRGNLDTDNIAAFYVDLGTVPFGLSTGPDVVRVQNIAMSKLRPYILSHFFGIDMGVPAPEVQIALKSISAFTLSTLDGSSDLNADFAAIADLTIAVEL